MTKALATLDQELVKKARALAGSSQKSTKVNYCKINYTDDEIPKGNFILKLLNTETNEYTDIDLGASFEAIVLMHTKKCGQWDQDSNMNILDSNEFDTYQETVELNDADGNFLESGTYRELKTKHPDLKLQIILYLYFPDRKTVVKLFVKGMPIVAFGDYENAVNQMGGALQAFTTKFTTKKEKNGAVVYYSLQFNQGDYVKDFGSMVNLAEECRKGQRMMNNKANVQDANEALGEASIEDATENIY